MEKKIYLEKSWDFFDDLEPVKDETDESVDKQFMKMSDATKYIEDILNIPESEWYRYIWAAVDVGEVGYEMHSGYHICNVLHYSVTSKPWCKEGEKEITIIVIDE